MKKPKIIRPTKLTLSLPEDIRAKLDLYLYSKVEHRVPFGAYQKFFIERILEFLARQEIHAQADNLPTEAPGEDIHLRLHSGLDIIACAAERGMSDSLPQIARWARGYQRLLKSRI